LEEVREGGKPLTGRVDISRPKQTEDAVLLEVRSGKYVFESVYQVGNKRLPLAPPYAMCVTDSVRLSRSVFR
jgi:hypothetical protein